MPSCYVRQTNTPAMADNRFPLHSPSYINVPTLWEQSIKKLDIHVKISFKYMADDVLRVA
jgi:hypothetical protein